MAAKHALPLALILTVVAAVARDAVAHPGQWSSLNARPYIQIHTALVRGDGSPYHSRILAWDGRVADGEEIGWQPGADACGATAWNSFTFGLGTWNPGANSPIWCRATTTRSSCFLPGRSWPRAAETFSPQSTAHRSGPQGKGGPNRRRWPAMT